MSIGTVAYGVACRCASRAHYSSSANRILLLVHFKGNLRVRLFFLHRLVSRPSTLVRRCSSHQKNGGAEWLHGQLTESRVTGFFQLVEIVYQ